MTMYDLAKVRSQFPALVRRHGDHPFIHTDAPGGTQVPQRVINAMMGVFTSGTANVHGAFATSREADAIIAMARRRSAAFMGTTQIDRVHFGANMTQLTFHLADALAQTWSPGEAIVITDLDHDANCQPWLAAAQRAGCEMRTWCFRIADGHLHLEDLIPLLTDGKVRLVAATAASNFLGSVLDVVALCRLCRQHGVLTHIDAVHYAPHRAVEVAAWGCDFCSISAYKFGGPHLGLQYIAEPHQDLPIAKVVPAANHGPERWEQGTQNLEAMAGMAAVCAYYADLVQGDPEDPAAIKRAWQLMSDHESDLAQVVIDGLAAIPALTLHGSRRSDDRTPTFALSHQHLAPATLCQQLGSHGIASWSGHFYATQVPARLGVDGVLRIGFAHYHGRQDADRLLEVLAQIAA